MRCHPHPEGTRHERGIALISALLVVLLITVIGAAFILTTSGERSIASNVQVARSSLLAADAGVRTMQQRLANYAYKKLDSLAVVNGGGGGKIITSPATLFPAGAQNFSSTNPNFTASATVTFADQSLADSLQTYNYFYTVTSTGSVGQGGQRQVQSTGLLRVSANRPSFANYLLFTDVQTMANGSQIWFASSSQFDGRVHTNGEFSFAFQPLFQDLVTSANPMAWYYNNSSSSHVELNASSNGTIDVPQFYGGFQRGVPNVPLPANSFNQQNAALGLDPMSSMAPSNATIRTQLGLSGSSPPPTGVYAVNSGGAMTGGLYVQGTVNQVKATADTVNHLQTYQFTQGATVTTITVDKAANTTSFVRTGSSPTSATYTGTPLEISYVNGAISDLRGPDRAGGTVLPALEESNRMLFAATGDITLTRDLTVEDFNSSQSIIGIYSSGGSVHVGTTAPNDMYVDAFVMAAGSSGEFSVDNYNSGSPRGTFHLRGGSITKYYGAFYTFNSSGVLTHGYARQFNYDRRGLKPPYFPSSGAWQTNAPSARTLAWKEI